MCLCSVCLPFVRIWALDSQGLCILLPAVPPEPSRKPGAEWTAHKGLLNECMTFHSVLNVHWVSLVLVRLASLLACLVNRYWWLFEFLVWILRLSQDVSLFNIHSLIHSIFIYSGLYYVWGSPLMIPNWAIFSPVEFQLRKKKAIVAFFKAKQAI